MRSLPELTEHLKARADDSHAAPIKKNNGIQYEYYLITFLKLNIFCSSGLVRFCVLHRIKPHAPPLVQVSVNFFEFRSCDHTTQAGCLTR